MVGVRGGLVVSCGFLSVCFCLVDFVCLLFVVFFLLLFTCIGDAQLIKQILQS